MNKQTPKSKYLFMMISEEIAGAQRLQLDYFRFIDYNKHSVKFGTNFDAFNFYLKNSALPVALVKLPPIDSKNNFFNRFIKFYLFFRKNSPDFVVFNQFGLETFTLPELMAAFIVTKGKVYIIAHSFPAAPKKYPAISSYFIKSIIAVSKALQDSLIDHNKLPKNKVTYCHHGVDINRFKPSQQNRIRFRHDHGIAESDFLIVSTARFSPRKNIDRLVNAFNVLAKERKNIRLILVGSGRDYERIHNMVNSLEEDIKRRVSFLGFQENIASILQACDLFALASDSEGLSIATIEALSCGLLSVVSKCAGQMEIIRDGWNGFLVEKSSDSMLEGLRRTLILSTEKSNCVSTNARMFVEKSFNLEKNVMQGLKLLNINSKHDQNN